MLMGSSSDSRNHLAALFTELAEMAASVEIAGASVLRSCWRISVQARRFATQLELPLPAIGTSVVPLPWHWVFLPPFWSDMKSR